MKEPLPAKLIGVQDYWKRDGKDGGGGAGSRQEQSGYRQMPGISKAMCLGAYAGSLSDMDADTDPSLIPFPETSALGDVVDIRLRELQRRLDDGRITLAVPDAVR